MADSQSLNCRTLQQMSCRGCLQQLMVGRHLVSLPACHPVVVAATVLLCAPAPPPPPSSSSQVVLVGFLNIRLPTWVRRLATRGAAVLPAALLQALGGDRLSYRCVCAGQERGGLTAFEALHTPNPALWLCAGHTCGTLAVLQPDTQ